jgi:hypothetical protein
MYTFSIKWAVSLDLHSSLDKDINLYIVTMYVSIIIIYGYITTMYRYIITKYGYKATMYGYIITKYGYKATMYGYIITKYGYKATMYGYIITKYGYITTICKCNEIIYIKAEVFCLTVHSVKA